MTRITRFIILSICIVLFLIAAPFLVFYSLGYRVDFEQRKIVGTGGIFVKGEPQTFFVSIDNATPIKTGYFNNSVFVQNLIPKAHTVTVTKEGYYDYQKHLEVKAKEVTKLEHLILFEKEITFTPLQENTNNMFFSPDGATLLATRLAAGNIEISVINTDNQQVQEVSIKNQATNITDVTWSGDAKKALLHIAGTYYLLDRSLPIPKALLLSYATGAKEVAFNPQNSSEVFYLTNKNVYSNLQEVAVVKNAITFKVQSNVITWLSTDGFLYTYNTISEKTTKESTVAILVPTASTWHILGLGANTFLQQNNRVLLLNKATKTFETFYDTAVTLKASPDQQKILTCNDHEVIYFFASYGNKTKVLLDRFSQKVSDCFWLNNEYVVFSLANNIVISEIDVRGNTNMITLPQTNLADMYFNQRNQKLYTLSEQNVTVSERILP